MSAFARLGIISLAKANLRSAKEPLQSISWRDFLPTRSPSNDNVPPAASAEPAAAKSPASHRRSTQETTVGPGWPHVLALAYGTANHSGGIFQTRWHRKLWRCTENPTSVRPTARGGSRGDFSLPCSMARARQCGVDGRGFARVRLVPGRQRPADIVGRYRHGQLPGRAASRSTK